VSVHARIASVIAIIFMAAGSARADGGVVRVWRSEGPFTITVFTAADPIVAGPLDVSVLVQDRADGVPILDGRVTLELATPAVVTATHDAATNKLLYAAWLDVPSGRSALRVRVERGDEIADVEVPVSAGPATTRLARYWPHLLVLPIAILLCILHQHLASARRTAASRPI